jgi:hypothetical protein
VSEWIALWVMLVALTLVVLWLVAWAHRHLVTLVLDVENLRNQVNALRDQVHDPSGYVERMLKDRPVEEKGPGEAPFPGQTMAQRWTAGAARSRTAISLAAIDGRGP